MWPFIHFVCGPTFRVRTGPKHAHSRIFHSPTRTPAHRSAHLPCPTKTEAVRPIRARLRGRCSIANSACLGQTKHAMRWCRCTRVGARWKIGRERFWFFRKRWILWNWKSWELESLPSSHRNFRSADGKREGDSGESGRQAIINPTRGLWCDVWCSTGRAVYNGKQRHCLHWGGGGGEGGWV